MSELSLPERIVHAAEEAIEGAARCVYPSLLGDRVDGFAVDLARAAGIAVVDVLAEDLKKKVRCPEINTCQKCRWLRAEIGKLHVLAQQVRDVPALKEV